MRLRISTSGAYTSFACTDSICYNCWLFVGSAKAELATDSITDLILSDPNFRIAAPISGKPEAHNVSSQFTSLTRGVYKTPRSGRVRKLFRNFNTKQYARPTVLDDGGLCGIALDPTMGQSGQAQQVLVIDTISLGLCENKPQQPCW